jgi:aryl-alcohol dehydrogenase-like predicted oxidoreductase
MPKISNSKLILGTVQMGLSYGINNTEGKISLDDSIEILNHAHENGIEVLDSAEAYGNAHHVIGSFHKNYPEKKFKVITKLPNRIETDILEKVSSYLQELQVDNLHALLFHSYSSYEHSLNKFNILNGLKLEGKIEKLGVSVYTKQEIEQVILDDNIEIIQIPFNLLDNNSLRGELLEKAKSHGKTIHTRSALLQGLFFKDSNEDSKTVQSLRNELIILKGIARKHNISMATLALSYCLYQNNIDNVLIGIDSINQLKDNIQAVKYQASEALVKEISAIKVNDVNLLNPSLWK